MAPGWDNGWLWLAVALVLALVELALPGYLFLGTAIAVALMGLVLLAGLWGGGLPGALVVVALLSGAVWLGLRRLSTPREGQVRIWRRDINDD
ncbi:hypothetical protein DRW48_03945 [Paracoccus suum]|uniref:NfeD family protein n=2 Tax=Paracoccus suum TaxID=2259340 RepID=A0A344PNU7_9RHOB|nr:hypothetical protein DRW48_03945 [Paracoccus suum]